MKHEPKSIWRHPAMVLAAGLVGLGIVGPAVSDWLASRRKNRTSK